MFEAFVRGSFEASSMTSSFALIVWRVPAGHLLRRAVRGVQDALVGHVVGARAQVRGGAQVDQLEPPVRAAEDDVQRLDVAVHQARRMQRLRGASMKIASSLAARCTFGLDSKILHTEIRNEAILQRSTPQRKAAYRM